MTGAGQAVVTAKGLFPSCGGKDGRLYFLTYFVTPLSCASAV
jgi:hypothetical protein